MKSSIKPALAALRKLPRDQYLQIQIERTEDGEDVLTACLFQKAPEGGWLSRAAYFHHPPGSPSEKLSAKPYQHDDRVVVGISADPGDPDTFVRLLNGMLTRTT